MTVRKNILVYLGLDIDLRDTFVVIEGINLYLVVKMAYIAHDGLVLHFFQVLNGNDIPVAGCSHEDISFRKCLFHRFHLKPFHGSLQCAYGIYFRYNDPGAV